MLLSPGRDPSIALDRSLIRQSANDRVASTSSTLRSNNAGTLWGRTTKKDVDWNPPNENNMALSRQRYLTLVHGDMETVRILPPTFTDAEMLAREWVRPPPDAMFSLRVPIEYASLQASRLIQGPYLWVSSEETYQIATTGVHGLRIEIVTDAPPPPDEPPPPPPPPVLEMPATFNLELGPGLIVALDTTCSTDDLDMSKTEDGTVVDGQFWGKMDIVHEGDTHKMEFSGTRLKNENLPSEFFFDQRVMSKLAAAARPTTARCHISVLSPSQQYCDVNLAFSPYWKLGVTWPPAERVSDNKVKFFLRVHPGGALEHFESSAVVTSLYYEAMPDTSAMDPASYITPQNGFAMPYSDFVPHLSKVLEDLGLSLQARTTFISHSVSAFSLHRHIAYRFMSPNRLAAAIDLSVTTDPCVFTRIYLLYRGLTDEEMGAFAEAGEPEAAAFNWKDVVGYSEQSKNASAFRIIETSIMECA